jgi:hypothetical protein
MKYTPKQLLVRRHVKITTPFRKKMCSHCGNYVWLEIMWRVGDKFYCVDCCTSKEKAFDLAFPQHITANDIAIRNDMEEAQKVFQKLMDDINSLNDGDVSPAVMNIILKHTPKV